MKLSEEDISKVMVDDMPEHAEYSQILYDSQDAAKSINSDFAKSQEASRRAWAGISDLMARCIARGMRLAREE